MSLVEDLMREMQQVRDAQDGIMKKLQHAAVDVSSIHHSCLFLIIHVYISLHVTGLGITRQKAELFIIFNAVYVY